MNNDDANEVDDSEEDHHDALRRSETRAPLRDRSWLAVLVVVLSDGTIFAARRAGPEDW